LFKAKSDRISNPLPDSSTTAAAISPTTSTDLRTPALPVLPRPLPLKTCDNDKRDACHPGISPHMMAVTATIAAAANAMRASKVITTP
jgi:hypothetical protein